MEMKELVIGHPVQLEEKIPVEGRARLAPATEKLMAEGEAVGQAGSGNQGYLACGFTVGLGHDQGVLSGNLNWQKRVGGLERDRSKKITGARFPSVFGTQGGARCGLPLAAGKSAEWVFVRPLAGKSRLAG